MASSTTISAVQQSPSILQHITRVIQGLQIRPRPDKIENAIKLVQMYSSILRPTDRNHLVHQLHKANYQMLLNAPISFEAYTSTANMISFIPIQPQDNIVIVELSTGDSTMRIPVDIETVCRASQLLFELLRGDYTIAETSRNHVKLDCPQVHTRAFLIFCGWIHTKSMFDRGPCRVSRGSDSDCSLDYNWLDVDTKEVIRAPRDDFIGLLYNCWTLGEFIEAPEFQDVIIDILGRRLCAYLGDRLYPLYTNDFCNWPSARTNLRKLLTHTLFFAIATVGGDWSSHCLAISNGIDVSIRLQPLRDLKSNLVVPLTMEELESIACNAVEYRKIFAMTWLFDSRDYNEQETGSIGRSNMFNPWVAATDPCEYL